jgi:Zn-dependent peptidase ImmA (M78 family)
MNVEYTPKIPFIRDSEIQRAVERLLVQHYKKDIREIEPPIDLEAIVSESMVYELEFDTVESEFGPGVLAYIDFELETIRIDESLKPNPSQIGRQRGRYRYTLAHELGHYVLHRPYWESDRDQPKLFAGKQDRLLCRTDLLREPKKPNEEIQADKFASLLLMPETLFRRAANELQDSSSLYRSEERLITALADRFQVSRQACEIRWEKLNMNHQFHRPLLA